MKVKRILAMKEYENAYNKIESLVDFCTKYHHHAFRFEALILEVQLYIKCKDYTVASLKICEVIQDLELNHKGIFTNLNL